MVEAEAQLQFQLSDAAGCVARPVRRRDARFMNTLVLDGHVYAGFLSEEAAGIEVSQPTPSQARALGRALARIHQRGDRVLARDRLTIDLNYLAGRPLERLEATVPPAWYGARFLTDLAEELASRARVTAGAPLPTGFCHGDLHLANLRFDEDRPTLFDFGECGFGPLCYDLACYWRKRLLSAPPQSRWDEEWCALLDGYSSVRSLTDTEIRAIPALGALRAIWTMARPSLPGCQHWGSDWLRDPEYFRAHLKMIARLAGEALGREVVSPRGP
jgi:Ser/Thr protein kinase RdoA (MazF antagonist)